MLKYLIAVASQDHVKNGVAGGFAQVCHGKQGPLKRMAEGDWIIYYSPTKKFGEKKPYQHFTAIGRIVEGEPYTFFMNNDFIPWRRNVQFLPSKDAAIEPLIDKLSFIHDKQRWGFPFRWGCFEIPYADFYIIAQVMGIKFDK
jgi:predicted RNA-binding protein